MDPGKRCLVTGGAGFIGAELTRQLVAQGNEVTVIDNLVNGKKENLASIPPQKIKLVVGDIRDKETVMDLLSGVDLVFHLACLGVRHSIHSPGENHAVNATATLQLLAAAREQKVGRFVYVSSSEIYGTATQVPMTEDHPPYPMTVYGASKLAGECYARAYHRTYGFPTVVLRPFNAYGPRCHHEGDSGEVIPKFLLRSLAQKPLVIFGDGSQTRDFTYVGDTARGIIAAGLSQQAIGETINLGSGFEITINELAKKVKQLTGQTNAEIIHETPRPGDVLRLFAETGKAQEILGFSPLVALEEGLQLLLKWYQASGKSPAELLATEKIRNWE